MTTAPAGSLAARSVTARSVAAGLAHSAQRFGDATALRTADDAITYRRLGDRATRTAAALDRYAPDAHSPIVVQLPMSIDAAAIVLGVFTARRPIVALDPELPRERVSGILDELARHGRSPGLFVAAAEHLSDARSVASPRGLAVLDASGITTDPAVAPTVDPVSPRQDRDDQVTSIQFTSGSTGAPKGVLHPDAMWLADAVFLRECLGIGPMHRVALGLPFSFGAGLNVLINSLLNGAEITVLDPRSAGTVAVLDAIAAATDHGADVGCTAFMTPNLLRTLLGARHDDARTHPAWQAMRRIITTGEPLTGELAAEAGRRAPRATVTNWVGSSETSALAYFDVRPGDPVVAGNLPAGRLAPGKAVTIDDVGRIVVSSPYLARGYLDEAMDAGRFGHDDSGTPTFRMGDRGQWLDGILTLHGRTDNAVKVRGYLVEPAEIEQALLSDGDLQEAVVVPITGPTGVVELAAYVVPVGTRRTPPPAVLRARLRERLPEWMIPAHTIELAALPRNVRGKVDRAALPVPTRVITPARDVTESAIASVWADVLHLGEVGRDENMYALGADSLTAQEILIAMTGRLDMTLTQAEAAAAPTVAQMAELVVARRHPRRRPSANGQQVRTAPTTVTLRSAPGRPAFCFTGAGASALAFVPFADRLARETDVGSVYAFAPNGLENRGIPDWTVAAAARRHLRDLRRLQPTGPYLLIGHSLGGFIALEVARRLRAAGEQVDRVVVLDTFLPQRFARTSAADDPGLSLTPPEEPLPRLELWRRRARIPLAGIMPMSPVDSARALEEVGRRVGIFHRPAPYDGDVLLVLGTENHDDPRIWRDRIVGGELTVEHVDCDHMSIIREPHIGVVVAAMTTDGR